MRFLFADLVSALIVVVALLIAPVAFAVWCRCLVLGGVLVLLPWLLGDKLWILFNERVHLRVVIVAAPV